MFQICWKGTFPYPYCVYDRSGIEHPLIHSNYFARLLYQPPNPHQKKKKKGILKTENTKDKLKPWKQELQYLKWIWKC